MKAIRVHEIGQPEVMKLETVPDLHPGVGQVVVRIKAAGVNPVDTYIRAGRPPRKPALPYTPGTDGAGLVELIGPGVTLFAVGDRVYVAGSATGTYAEQSLCAAEDVHPLPENVSFSQGAGVGIPYVTAYIALFERAKVKPAETLLVHGATGGVGLAAVQLAAAAGVTVVGTGGTERGRNLVLDQGAVYALDHSAAGYLDQLQSMTEGRGVDVVLEMLANVNLDRDLKILAPRGRLVIIGSRGRIEIDPRDVMSRNAKVLGLQVLSLGPAETAPVQAALGAGLVNGTLRPVIGKEYPLAKAAAAHHEILEQHAAGKLVLIP